MHEGVLSLMQMAKTCAALKSLDEAGGLSICVMTHPTTGGVTASFASVTDFVLAEPGALIGFAGPRVIATTLKQELPPGFQRSEFLLSKGMLDAIVPRSELRARLALLIDYWSHAPVTPPADEAAPEAAAASAEAGTGVDSEGSDASGGDGTVRSVPNENGQVAPTPEADGPQADREAGA